jgi:cytoskeletal protein RodZ
MTLTVGQRLHIARESKGLSLQDVAHQTRMPVQRLRDLEEDTYTTFGGLTYARTFLKDYSQLMGVDAHAVLDELHAPPLGGVNDYRYLVQSFGKWTRNRSSFSYARDNNNTSVMTKGRSMGLMAGICGAVMLIGVGMLVGAAMVGEHKTAAPPPVMEEVRTARPAPLPETQSPSFATPAAQAVPQALPVEDGGKAQPQTFKKPKIAPGVIPKALPVVDVPKGSKPQRQ